MKRTEKGTFNLSPDELGILDAIGAQNKLDRSEVIRHLIIQNGIIGGGFPVTAKVLALPPAERARVVKEIRAKLESSNPPTPECFKHLVKSALGKDDPATMESAADKILREILSYGNVPPAETPIPPPASESPARPNRYQT